MFANEEWSTIPFLTVKKTPQDHFNDVLLQIPHCFLLRARLREQFDQGLQVELEATRSDLEKKALELMARLDVYWLEFKEEANIEHDYAQYIELSNFQGEPEDWIITASHDVVFQNSLTATTIPSCDAAMIIVNTILKDISLGCTKAYLQRIVIHSASIFEAVRWHNQAGPESGGDISLVFCMKVVLRCTPSLQQQNKAEEELKNWGASRGFQGISQPWLGKIAHKFQPRLPQWTT